jgi:hypothetical protein
MWSSQLGGGLNDTDAKDDDQAWLAISRTVLGLGNNHDNFPCSDVQFQLARCTIVLAFEEYEEESTSCQKDWLSKSVAETLKEWNVQNDMRKQHFWIAIASASAVANKLASAFPDDEPTKCLSIIECAVVLIAMAVSDLSLQIDATRDLLGSEEASSELGNDTRAAFSGVLGIIEENADRISSMCRSRMMQSKCFPLASSMVECLKSYARLIKIQSAPPTKGKCISFQFS